jgi:hypothetical protein
MNTKEHKVYNDQVSPAYRDLKSTNTRKDKRTKEYKYVPSMSIPTGVVHRKGVLKKNYELKIPPLPHSK